MKLFDYDSPFMRFMSQCTDLMILNLLWLGCCLPVVTVGASTAAMYSCLMNRENRETSLSRQFFVALKSNFARATGLWGIQAVVLAAVGSAFFYYLVVWAKVSFLMRILCLVPAIWLLMGASLVFPLQARFENTVGQTLKNAMLISAANLPTALAVTALNLIPLGILYLNVTVFLQTAIIWLLLGGAVIAYWNTLMLEKVFARYIPEAK